MNWFKSRAIGIGAGMAAAGIKDNANTDIQDAIDKADELNIFEYGGYLAQRYGMDFVTKKSVLEMLIWLCKYLGSMEEIAVAFLRKFQGKFNK